MALVLKAPFLGMFRHPDFLAAMSAAGGIVTQLETLDLILRVASGLVALVAGGLAIYRHFKPKG